jgi:hypothetical protein
MANCPMCGEVWNETRCGVCQWQEGASPRYTSSRLDKRKSGVGAMKGWVTRRRRHLDQREALNRLIEVADGITSDLVVGERAADPGKYIVGALTLVKWRDGIVSALKILESRNGNR